MQCVILAAGEGIRMRPLTLDTPKPMIRVLGKPILEHLIDSLPSEVNELIIVIGYLSDQIKNYFGFSFKGKRIKYVLQKKKLGTYNALELCESYLNDDYFFMLYADDFHSSLSFKRMYEKKNLCVLVHTTENPERFGVVTLNKDGTISEIEEKPSSPKTNLVSCGPMVLDKRVFNYPPKRTIKGEYYIPDSITAMICDYPIYAVKTDWWIPIGYPEDIKKAEEFLISHK